MTTLAVPEIGSLVCEGRVIGFLQNVRLDKQFAKPLAQCWDAAGARTLRVPGALGARTPWVPIHHRCWQALGLLSPPFSRSHMLPELPLLQSSVWSCWQGTAIWPSTFSGELCVLLHQVLAHGDLRADCLLS